MKVSKTCKKIIVIMMFVALTIIIGGAAFHRSIDLIIPFAFGVILTTALNALKLVMMERAAEKIVALDAGPSQNPSSADQREIQTIYEDSGGNDESEENEESDEGEKDEESDEGEKDEENEEYNKYSEDHKDSKKVESKIFYQAKTPAEAKAKSFAGLQYLIRYLLTIAVFLGAAYVPFIDILGAIFGIFTLTIAMYVWRFVDKGEFSNT